MCCLADRVEDRGLGDRRGDGIDRDVVGRELLAERLGQADDAGLGGRIGGGVGVAFLAGDRGDIGDAAVVPLDHAGDDRLAAIERAGEVDADHLVPLLGRVLPGLGDRPGDAGVVDEDVDLAEGVKRLVAGALDGGIVGDVDGRPRSPCPGSAVPSPSSRRAPCRGPRWRRSAPPREQTLDHGAADALGAAGHDGGTAGEIVLHGHARPPRLARDPSHGWQG